MLRRTSPNRARIAAAVVIVLHVIAIEIAATPHGTRFLAMFQAYDGCRCADCIAAFGLIVPIRWWQRTPVEWTIHYTMISVALAVALALYALAFFTVDATPRRRCRSCRYDIRGLAICPECGRPATD